MKARFGDVEVACEQAPVDIFNIKQLNVEVQPAEVDGLLQDAMKGKGVIGAGRNTQVDRRHGVTSQV